MEASNVYFTSFKATEHENLLQKLHRLMKTAGFETIDFTDKRRSQPLVCDHLFLFTADAYASASFALSNAISLEMISSQIWVTFFPSVATVMSATAS